MNVTTNTEVGEMTVGELEVVAGGMRNNDRLTTYDQGGGPGGHVVSNGPPGGAIVAGFIIGLGIALGTL